MENLKLTIESYNNNRFLKAFDLFVNKAKKMNLPIPIILSETKKQINKKITYIKDQEVGIGILPVPNFSDTYLIDVIEYEINIINTFKFQGWDVIATIYYPEAIIDLINVNYTFPENLGLNYIKCDHCGHNHSHRLKSFIIKNENNEYRQVGSKCIQDFIGVSLSILTKLQAELNIIIDLNDDGEYDELEHSSNNSKFYQYLLSRKVYNYSDIISVAKMVMLNGKYIKKEYDYIDNNFGYTNFLRLNLEEATVDKMEEILDNNLTIIPINIDYFNKLQEYLSNIEISEEDTESFLYKIKSIVGIERIRRSDFWIVACSIQSYEKHLEKQHRIELGKTLNHIGIVGKKVAFKATIIDIKTGESDYGIWYLYLMEDENGNQLSKLGTIDSSYIIDSKEVKIGSIVFATGMVKEHSLYNQIPVTLIGRLSKHNIIYEFL
jgi:hypothetical protein